MGTYHGAGFAFTAAMTAAYVEPAELTALDAVAVKPSTKTRIKLIKGIPN